MAQQFERLAAELTWLVNAPDLILPPPQLDFSLAHEPVRLSIAELTRHAEHYKPGFRLGDRFENLVWFYLRYAHKIIDIKRNIQVKSQSTTVGELDFLVPLNDHWTHLEVALKIYLLDGSGRSLSHFVGTRRDDCLETKWHRMLNHQVRLSETTDARDTLEQMGIAPPLGQALWVKGWLFYHRGRVPATLPPELNPQHQHGWWLTQSELQALEAAGQQYLIPTKRDWLVPASMVEEPLLVLEQLKEIVSSSERAQLILNVSRGADGKLVERSRGFVVSDSWPESS